MAIYAAKCGGRNLLPNAFLPTFTALLRNFLTITILQYMAVTLKNRIKNKIYFMYK